MGLVPEELDQDMCQDLRSFLIVSFHCHAMILEISVLVTEIGLIVIMAITL
jgi:hypothetical protein